MPMNAASMLAANQPQTPNGTALNASAMLGLPGLGNNLQDDLENQIRQRRKQLLPGPHDSTLYGASSALFGGMR